jgi:integrase
VIAVAKVKLTKRTIDALGTGARDQLFWDDELAGFGLKVTPAGRKVYLLQYRTGGRGSPTKRYTIGAHGIWTPAKAREEAERLLAEANKGVDVHAAKVERNRVSNDLAFSEYADRFLRDYVKHEWTASYEFAEGILRLHVKPVLKARPLPSITKAHVTAIFDKLPAGKAALRRNVYAVVRRLFRWAVGRGDIERSPLEGFEAPAAAAAARDRVLDDEELRLVWNASGELIKPFCALYRLLILTGQRREEVGALPWTELDRQAALWRLPAARAKNGKASDIHLSAHTVAALDAVAGGEKWPRRGFVLTTTGDTPISGYSKAKARLDGEMLRIARKAGQDAGENPEDVSIQRWRVHDLRRTLATGMQRLGVRFEVTEAILNHVSGARSGVAGVYQRHDWKDEKRAALDAWGEHVRRVLDGTAADNVVLLAAARA